MSAGFRKSFLGFNCDDVMAYIEDSHKSYLKKEEEYNARIKDLGSVIEKLNADIQNLSKEKECIEAKLKEFTDKKEELERLSTNIGKLYLVAQSNAKAIMKNSEENRAIAAKETEKNLSSIDNAQESLNEIKEDIIESSTEFVKKINELGASLDSAKSAVLENENDSDERIKEFETLSAKITE